MEIGGTVIYVDDVPATLDFYRKGFGLEPKFVDLDVQLPNRDSTAQYQYAELATTGGPFQLATHALGELLLPGYVRPPDGRPAGIEIAFFCDNVTQAFERAVQAGATVLAEPKEMPWGQTAAYVRGVEGTCFGLCSRPVDVA